MLCACVDIGTNTTRVLVSDEDRDLTARLWRVAGRASGKLDDRAPLRGPAVSGDRKRGG